ncbi:MAG: tripartite tricarboxylate transporter substrate binding protein [Proteobacteria bacterium]|nr:tripartite tricarboxylate transporter substrate binding protein [Pseudomonadota bacterium]
MRVPALICVLLVTFAARAVAEDYPSRPVRVVVPNPAGGPTDVVARLIGPKLGERLGQTIVVDNRAGADGVIGSDLVAKAPPDGYTLLLTSASHAMHPAVYPNLPFDTEAAFAPIALLVRTPYMLVVHPGVPARSTAELIAYAKQRPGKLDYGSAGNGGGVHLSTELFKTVAGIDLVHIPYKGGGPVLMDLAGGQIQVSMVPVVVALPLVRDGWYGVLAPAGTAAAIIARLNAALDRIMREPDVIQRIVEIGGEAAGGSPAGFGTLIHGEIARWGAVAKQANVRLD